MVFARELVYPPEINEMNAALEEEYRQQEEIIKLVDEEIAKKVTEEAKTLIKQYKSTWQGYPPEYINIYITPLKSSNLQSTLQ